MILVSSEELGGPGYARAIRQGVLIPLTPHASVPVDIPLTPGIRANALEPIVPDSATVTGLAGLWTDGHCRFPQTLDVLRRRGTHRVARRLLEQSRIRIHAGDPGPRPIRHVEGLSIASVDRCAVDALRWAPLGDAIPAVWAALRSGGLDPHAIETALAATPGDRSRRRARSAWHAIERCLDVQAGSGAIEVAA